MRLFSLTDALGLSLHLAAWRIYIYISFMIYEDLNNFTLLGTLALRAAGGSGQLGGSLKKKTLIGALRPAEMKSREFTQVQHRLGAQKRTKKKQQPRVI